MGAARDTFLAHVDDPETYPMQPKQHSLEYLRDFAHLRPRTNLFGAVTRIRHCLSMAADRCETTAGNATRRSSRSRLPFRTMSSTSCSRSVRAILNA